MKLKTIETYKYNELSENAKRRAFDNWSEQSDYCLADDNRKTLSAFEDIFPVKVKDYEYGYHNYINWKFTEEDNISELSGLRLYKHLQNKYSRYLYKGNYIGSLKREKFTPVYSKVMFHNSCVLTGYCMDDDILKPIYEFLKKPSENITFYDLMSDCLESWVISCRNDYEYHTSEKAFIETCEANDYMFDENGGMI